MHLYCSKGLLFGPEMLGVNFCFLLRGMVGYREDLSAVNTEIHLETIQGQLIVMMMVDFYQMFSCLGFTVMTSLRCIDYDDFHTL